MAPSSGTPHRVTLATSRFLATRPARSISRWRYASSRCQVSLLTSDTSPGRSRRRYHAANVSRTPHLRCRRCRDPGPVTARAALRAEEEPVDLLTALAYWPRHRHHRPRRRLHATIAGPRTRHPRPPGSARVPARYRLAPRLRPPVESSATRHVLARRRVRPLLRCPGLIRSASGCEADP